MQEFIHQAMQALGTSEDTTRTATAGVLDFISKNAPQEDVAQLMDKLPGASDLMASAGAGETGGLKGLMAKAGSLVGGGTGLVGLLQQSGLSASSAPKFLSMFVDFAKQKAGAGVVDRITGAVPGLAELAHK